jgi:hypothetical protein
VKGLSFFDLAHLTHMRYGAMLLLCSCTAVAGPGTIATYTTVHHDAAALAMVLPGFPTHHVP